MKKMHVIRKKSQKDNVYVQLYVDLGYKNLPLSFDIATIVELLGLTFEYINNLVIDKPVYVGDFNKAGK